MAALKKTRELYPTLFRAVKAGIVTRFASDTFVNHEVGDVQDGIRVRNLEDRSDGEKVSRWSGEILQSYAAGQLMHRGTFSPFVTEPSKNFAWAGIDATCDVSDINLETIAIRLKGNPRVSTDEVYKTVQ